MDVGEGHQNIISRRSLCPGTLVKRDRVVTRLKVVQLLGTGTGKVVEDLESGSPQEGTREIESGFIIEENIDNKDIINFKRTEK